MRLPPFHERGRASTGGPPFPAQPTASRQQPSRQTSARDLFAAALRSQPELIGASDGILVSAQTLGVKETLPLMLERVMTTQANRGSLMGAMRALAPQWGGRPEQVNLLCDRYSPMITAIADYTPEACKIDAAYSADFWYGEQRAAAHQLLMFMPNPELDYARLMDALESVGDPEAYLDRLQILAETRPLTPKEAQRLDFLMAEVLHPGDPVGSENWLKSLPEALKLARIWADAEPHNPRAVLRYYEIASDVENQLGTPKDRADHEARLREVLRAIPTAPRVWLVLGRLIAYRTEGLEGIRAAAPYLANAIWYSNYDADVMLASLRLRLPFVRDPQNLIKLVDLSHLSPAQLEDYHKTIHCPLSRDIYLQGTVCMNEGYGIEECADGMLPTPWSCKS